MKRYFLFCMKEFYPFGGMQDFFGAYDTIAECHNIGKENDSTRYQIFDSYMNTVIHDQDPPAIEDVHPSEEYHSNLYPRLKSIYAPEVCG